MDSSRLRLPDRSLLVSGRNLKKNILIYTYLYARYFCRSREIRSRYHTTSVLIIEIIFPFTPVDPLKFARSSRPSTRARRNIYLFSFSLLFSSSFPSLYNYYYYYCLFILARFLVASFSRTHRRRRHRRRHPTTTPPYDDFKAVLPPPVARVLCTETPTWSAAYHLTRTVVYVYTFRQRQGVYVTSRYDDGCECAASRCGVCTRARAMRRPLRRRPTRSSSSSSSIGSSISSSSKR